MFICFTKVGWKYFIRKNLIGCFTSCFCHQGRLEICAAFWLVRREFFCRRKSTKLSVRLMPATLWLEPNMFGSKCMTFGSCARLLTQRSVAHSLSYKNLVWNHARSLAWTYFAVCSSTKTCSLALVNNGWIYFSRSLAHWGLELCVFFTLARSLTLVQKCCLYFSRSLARSLLSWTILFAS